MRLSNTDRDILVYLARIHEANRWDLKKEINRAYSGVYRSITKLLDLKLIKILREEPSERNFTIDTQIYRLTGLGLYNALFIIETWKHIEDVASAHKDKVPLVFGKWDHYIEKTVIDIVVRRLIHGVRAAYHTLIYIPPDVYAKFDEDNESDSRLKDPDLKNFNDNKRIFRDEIETALTDAVLGVDHVFGYNQGSNDYNADQERMAKAILSDKDLRQHFESRTRNRLDSYRRLTSNLENNLRKVLTIVKNE